MEEGIACMQPAHGSGRGLPISAGRPAKNYSEIWVMYVLANTNDKSKKIKVITAWRYPGKSPERDPIPVEVLKEIKKLI